MKRFFEPVAVTKVAIFTQILNLNGSAHTVEKAEPYVTESIFKKRLWVVGSAHCPQ